MGLLYRSIFAIMTLVFSLLASACMSGQTSAATLTPESAYAVLTSQGLTCQAQRAIASFNETELRELARLLQRSNLSVEQRGAIVSNRETNCFAEATAPGNTDHVSTQTDAITGTYSVVFIPEGTTSGNYASYVFRDSSSSSWMCNSGSPEDPADYVVQFHLQGAYFSRNNLELQGQNWWGSCYLNNTNASRVYSDDDVRTCIGYWTVVLCGGTPPLTSDIVIGL